MNFFELIKKINRPKSKLETEGAVALDAKLKSVDSTIHAVTSFLNAGNFFESLTQLEQGLNRHLYNDSLIELFFSRYLDVNTLNLTGLELEEHFSKFPRIIEILFKYKANYFDLLRTFINYCLEKNLIKLIDQSLQIIYDSSFMPHTLWLLSDLLLARQRDEKASEIYSILSKRTLVISEDYLYAGLSEHRLGNAQNSFICFENGLKIYPNDEDLKKYFFQICAANHKIERAILFFSNEKMKLDQVCRNLLQTKDLDFLARVQVIEFCLKNNFIDLAEGESQRIQSSSVDTGELWLLADLFHANGRDSEPIYVILSKLKPINPKDYIYCALSTQRLNDFTTSLAIFEEGIKAYPEDDYLRSLYVEVCTTQYKYYPRYSKFMQNQYGPGSDLVLSLIDFCKKSFTIDARLNFLIFFKNIERDCTPTDFALLKQHFLESLTENRVSFQTAKNILFFNKCFDNENDFCLASHEILKKLFESFHEDSPKVLYTLDMIASLSLPMVHCAKDSNKIAMDFINACKFLASKSTTLTEPIRDSLSGWFPWQFLFCYHLPEQYPHMMRAFEQFAFTTWPKLNYTSPHSVERFQTPSKINKKIKIGFSFHDAPMLSGLLRQLDKNIFDTVFLHPGEVGSSKTAKDWIISADKIVEYSDADTLSAIETIAAEKLDIIISGPSLAASFFPMMARLAPLQMVLLEPNWTNGMRNTDYYISWQPAEPVKSEDFYHTAVAYLEHPPYWIERPSLDVNLSDSQEARDEIRKRLLNCGSENHVYLCANTPPKIHPLMDEVFADLLEDPDAVIVFLRGEYPSMKTLQARLREKLGHCFDRLIVLPTLAKEDAHSLLMAVDCCLDSFPICGMSSSFDAAMLGVPLVTLPNDLPFGKWTTAIYDYIGVSGLTARDQKEYIQLARRLATDVSWRTQKALELKEKATLYVESRVAFEGLQKFIIEAWNRKLLDLPPGNWIGEEWHEISKVKEMLD